MQFTDRDTAIATADSQQAEGVRTIAFRDPETGLYGIYTYEEYARRDGPGYWVNPLWVVRDTGLSDEENALCLRIAQLADDLLTALGMPPTVYGSQDEG